MTGHTDAEALRAAAATCRLAARTFAAEVDAPFHQALIGLCQAPRLRALGLVPLDDELLQLPTNRVLDELAVEYCRLFIGPNPICPPYASARRRGALGTATIQTLHTFLHDHAMQPRLPADAPIAAADHIAVALSLLEELYTTASGAPHPSLEPDRARTALGQLHEFLTGWALEFLHEVHVLSRRGPYAPVARLTLMVLHDPHLRPQPTLDPAGPPGGA